MTLSVLFAVAVAVPAAAFRLGDVRAVVWADGLDRIEGQWGYYGAKELAENLSKVTGKQVAFLSESHAPTNGVVIYVGDCAATRSAGLSAAKLRNAEWRTVTRPGVAYVVAKTGMACSYGCTDFLERFARYFYLVLDMRDPFKVDPDRTVPVSDRVRRHAVYNRTKHVYGKRWPKTSANYGARHSRRTAARSFVEIEPELIPSKACAENHSYFDYVPPEKYAKEHPEYYSLGPDGQRHFKRNDQSELCFSNPEVFDIAYASLVGFVEKDRAGKRKGEWPVIYDFSQMDNCGYLCLCPECKRVIAKYNRTPDGHAEGGDQGLQLEFVNRLARKIRERYPDVIIRTFAYVSTEEPPKEGTIRPEPNVMIRMCDLYSKCDDQLPLEHPFNVHRRELIEQWKELAKHLEVWDYHLGGTPLDVSVDAIAADIRFLHGLGIDTVYDETHYNGSIFFELCYFVSAQIYREPRRDVDTLVGVWCGIFGKGAPDMRRAIDFWRKVTLENPPASAANWHMRVLPYMTAANLEKFVGMMRAAYAKESAGLCRARISRAIAEAEKELLAVYRRTPGMGKRYGTLRADYIAKAEEGFSDCDLWETERQRELKAIREDLEVAELHFDDLPAAFDGTAADALHCLDWHGMVCSGRASKVADPKSTRGTAGRFVPEHAEFWARLNDNELHTNQNFQFHPVRDGEYHWTKVGIGNIARNSYIGFPYLNPIKFNLPHLYIECDGLPVNPNWYEYWVSCRIDGEGAFYVDRLAMRRVPPPKK